MLFLIDHSNRDLYADEFDGILTLRHDVICGERNWSGVSSTNGQERDQFDTPEATYIGAQSDNGRVRACIRLNSSIKPTLTSTVFDDLVEFTDLPAGDGIYDVSRFVVSRDARGEPFGVGLDVMCAMYEWGLANNARGFTAVVTTRVLAWVLQIGMNVQAMGLPREIDGEMTLAIYLPATEDSLNNMYARSRRHLRRLFAFMPLPPAAIAPPPLLVS